MAIPYENTTLPGYFYRAGDPGVPRPTVIMHTGFDGTAAGMRQILQLWAVGSILVGAGRSWRPVWCRLPSAKRQVRTLERAWHSTG